MNEKDIKEWKEMRSQALEFVQEAYDKVKGEPLTNCNCPIDRIISTYSEEDKELLKNFCIDQLALYVGLQAVESIFYTVNLIVHIIKSSKNKK